MKKKKIKELLPVRSLKDLVKDEDGFVSKETILKVGLMTAAGLGAWGTIADASTTVHVDRCDVTTVDTCTTSSIHVNTSYTCY